MAISVASSDSVEVRVSLSNCNYFILEHNLSLSAHFRRYDWEWVACRMSGAELSMLSIDFIHLSCGNWLHLNRLNAGRTRVHFDWWNPQQWPPAAHIDFNSRTPTHHPSTKHSILAISTQKSIFYILSIPLSERKICLNFRWNHTTNWVLQCGVRTHRSS